MSSKKGSDRFQVEHFEIGSEDLEQKAQQMAGEGESAEEIKAAMETPGGPARLFKQCTVLKNMELVNGMPVCKNTYDVSKPELAAHKNPDGSEHKPFCRVPKTGRMYATKQFIEEHGFTVHDDSVVELLNQTYVFPGGYAVREYDVMGYSVETASRFLKFDVGVKEDMWTEAYLREIESDPSKKLPDLGIEEHVQSLLDYLSLTVEYCLNQRDMAVVTAIIKLSTILACLKRPDLAGIIFQPEKCENYAAGEIAQLFRGLGIEVPAELAAEIMLNAVTPLGIKHIGTDKLH